MHSYLDEGMEESSFLEARENLAALVLDYEEVCREGFGSDDEAEGDEY